jgi:hypothetical protein
MRNPETKTIILRAIREAIKQEEHRYTVHAQIQMAERHITSLEITEALLNDTAEIIEDYPDDKYSPSCLIYGVTVSGRLLHVQSNHQAVIITVYEPDPEKWDDFKRRRRSL